MLISSGHCASCGERFDMSAPGRHAGAACPDPLCPSHHPAQWSRYFEEHPPFELGLGSQDWRKLREWVAPFKAQIQNPEKDQG